MWDNFENLGLGDTFLINKKQNPETVKKNNWQIWWHNSFSSNCTNTFQNLQKKKKNPFQAAELGGNICDTCIEEFMFLIEPSSALLPNGS